MQTDLHAIFWWQIMHKNSHAKVLGGLNAIISSTVCEQSGNLKYHEIKERNKKRDINILKSVLNVVKETKRFKKEKFEIKNDKIFLLTTSNNQTINVTKRNAKDL